MDVHAAVEQEALLHPPVRLKGIIIHCKPAEAFVLPEEGVKVSPPVLWPWNHHTACTVLAREASREPPQQCSA